MIYLVIAMLFIFVALGLVNDRWGKRSYAVMGLTILTYIAVAYISNALNAG